MIVDDEEKLRALLARIIRLEGLTVLEAESLKAGGRLLERENIDVVLCDVKLPDGNGVDFVRDAKVKFPSVEMILLTAYGAKRPNQVHGRKKKRIAQLEQRRARMGMAVRHSGQIFVSGAGGGASGFLNRASMAFMGRTMAK